MSRMTSRISVVIPAWNASSFLAEAVASVQAQTVAPDEIVVVDDASTDDTFARAVDLAHHDTRIRVISQPNSGPGGARDRGIAESHGELIAMLDADDIWLPTKLERQRALLDVTGDVRQAVFTYGENFFDGVEPRGPLGPMAAYLPSALLASRDVFLANGPFHSSGQLADWVPWFLRLREVATITVVEEVLVRRRVHADNFTTRQRDHRSEYAAHVGAALRRRRNQAGAAAE